MANPYFPSRIFGEYAKYPLDKIKDNKWTAYDLERAVREHAYIWERDGGGHYNLSAMLVPADKQSIWLPYKASLDIPHDVEQGMILPISDLPTPQIHTVANQAATGIALLGYLYTLSHMGIHNGWTTLFGILGVVGVSQAVLLAETEWRRRQNRNGVLLPLDKTIISGREWADAWEKRAYVYFRPKEIAPKAPTPASA